MKTKQTPGPWTIDFETKQAINSYRFWENQRISTPHGDIQINQGANRGQTEQKANLVLLAAAPELLMACKHALNELDDNVWAKTMLKKAIAKAERTTA